MSKKEQTSGIQNYIPILGSLGSYKKEWLRFDIIAALSVWALLVPQSIAYASIAGMPSQYGLYAALGALLGYALFGTAHQVITGPSAAVAAVSASVIALLASSGSDDWIAYTAALAITAGLIYILLGVLKMGWLSNFLSRAVLEGFVFAFGFGLIIDQTHKILGVDSVDGSYFQVLIGTLQELPETSIPTLVVGGTALIALLLMRRFTPKLPRALIVVILAIAASSLLDLESYGVAIVGEVPTGLPTIGLPGISSGSLLTLVVGGLAVLFVGFSESLAAARESASKHNYEIDSSQEMTAQGAANGISGLFGGFAVDGSLSKTTVADLAGQKTQVASLIVAFLVLLTLLFLAGLFTTLPNAVLGAVVIDAALGLIKIKEYRRYQLNKRDFAAFMAAAIGLFFISILAGVVIGAVVSLLMLIASASQSPVRRLAWDRSENVYVIAENHPEAEMIPGIVVAENVGPLFFADAENFRAAVMDLVQEYEPHTVVVDLVAATDIDMDGVEILTKIAGELERQDIKLLLSRVSSADMELFEKIGAMEEIGSENIYESVRAAVEAAQQSDTVSPDETTRSSDQPDSQENSQ
jgi:high affinity sulfate transporter 1